LSGLLVWGTARALRWSREVTGVLMLLVPLGNTGFVGIPLVEAHLGSKAIPYAILYDQLGTFVALNIYGVITACYYSSATASACKIARNILLFPPFISLILALLLTAVTYPVWLDAALGRFSSTLVPVVMVAVGLQWRLKLNAEYLAPFLVGLLAILVISPAIAWLGMKLFDVRGLVAQVVVLEAAMPAMISAGVLAISHQLAPRFAAALVGYSLLLGLMSVWCWRLLLE
jgi:malate permease and related proteins